MRKAFLLPAALALGLAGCGDTQMSPTTQRVGGGAAIGALGGAAIGSLSGNAGWGALIGAGAGAAGGFLYDRSMQSRERAFNEGVAAGRASPR
jgi:membrane associated rhomboid family serine protease